MRQLLRPVPPPTAETPLVPVQLSPERLQSIGVKFGVVERKSLQDEIRTTGTVAIDERTRFLCADAHFRPHREGFCGRDLSIRAARASRYSPFTARNLLPPSANTCLLSRMRKTFRKALFRALPTGVASLLDSSRERLKQWNIPAQEIARLESTGQVGESPGNRLSCFRLHHRTQCASQLNGAAGNPALHHRRPLYSLGPRSDFPERLGAHKSRAHQRRSPWIPIRAAHFEERWISFIPMWT